MSTLAELKQTIAEDINRTDLTSNIAAEITRAINYYSSEQLWFLEGTGTVTATASVASYDFPADAFSVETMLITISGSKVPLSRKSYAEIDEKDSGAYTGIPSEWAFFGNQIRLYPVPNNQYVLTLSYRKTLDPPATDGASNDWTTTAFDLIRNRVEKILYRNVIRDVEGVTLAESGEQAELASLISDTTAKISTGRISKSGF